MKWIIAACFVFLFSDSKGSDSKKDLIQYFAFGGVGFAGSTSKGEKKFQKVINAKNPLEGFSNWFKTASFQGKTYCLVAFYYLDPERYKIERKRKFLNNNKIRCASGCIVYSATESEVTARIEKGDFAMYIPEKLRKSHP